MQSFKSGVDDAVTRILEEADGFIANAIKHSASPVTFSPDPSNLSLPPSVIRDAFLQLREQQTVLLDALEQLTRYIELRCPSVKEEDNVGVNTQQTVLKVLRSIIAKISGDASVAEASECSVVFAVPLRAWRAREMSCGIGQRERFGKRFPSCRLRCSFVGGP